jgi:hypothetical protein
VARGYRSIRDFFAWLLDEGELGEAPMRKMKAPTVAVDPVPGTGRDHGPAAMNMDFRPSVGELPTAMRPLVRTYPIGEGPFQLDRNRIKQRRIGRAATDAAQGGRS